MEIKEQLERWKILAEVYAREDKRVLIKDIEDNWYFADIIIVGENTIEIQCYAPEQRAGKKYVLYWANLKEFEPVREQ